jgi:hypothetical protein
MHAGLQPSPQLESHCAPKRNPDSVRTERALVGEHMDQPLFGARKSLGELITELLDIEREIREQKLELFGMTGPVDAVAALTAARKANELAARLRVLEVIEGLKPDEPRGSADALLVAGKQVNDQSGPS